MINSRSLDDLDPIVRPMMEEFLSKCADNGIDLLVTSTYRDFESQDALYAQGRTAPGRKVTNARAGQSFHNYGVAMDIVPLRNGKPVWNTSGADWELWEAVANIGESCGLEWAGRWRTFKEYAHFQYTGGLTLKDFQNGATLD